MLPVELMDKIVLYTSDLCVADTLQPYITQYVYDKFEKNILIYGQVQGGKTKEIVNILKSSKYNNINKVLVVQNSLLVLRQYISRLRGEGIAFQVVDRYTTELKTNVLIVLNNKYRYAYFSKLITDKYILLLDEADQTYKNCPLTAYKTFHITATPFYPKKAGIMFDKIIEVETHKNYYGLNKLQVEEVVDVEAAVNDFMKTKTGMMLINKYSYIEEMQHCARTLSRKYTLVPVVLLTTEKIMFLNGKHHKIGTKPISKVIDALDGYPHVVFIANRLSNRGLSYVSSDYKRHLTHQVTKIRTYVNSFIQSLRILGIYTDSPQLKLYVDSEERFEKHKNYIKEFIVHTLVKRVC